MQWLTDKGTQRIDETIARLRVQLKDSERLKLKDISLWQIDKWRNARLKAGIKPATINRATADLKSALARAVEWGLVDSHPLAKLKPFKTDKRPKVRYLLLNDEDTRLMDALARRDERIKAKREKANQWRRERGYKELRNLRACRFADHLAPMVIVSLNTGLRRGELFSLKWDNVDLPGRMLTVVGETAKSQQTRHVPLNDAVFGALVAWRNQTESQVWCFRA
jgi:integrase